MYIERCLKETNQTIGQIKTDALLEKVLSEHQLRMFRDVICNLKSRSFQKVLESDQKIENYLLKQNRNDQF